MANTKPKPPYDDQESFALVEELCLELRSVGGECNFMSSHGSSANEHVRNVQEIHSILAARNVDIAPRIAQLTNETGWLMEQLLSDCLQYPETVPYVRDLDGVRRVFRCYMCEQREVPIDGKLLYYCDSVWNELPVRLNLRVF